MNPLSKSKISDIATSYAGGTPKRTVAGYYNGTIPWVKSGEINSVNIFSSEEKITDEGLRNSSAKLVEPGAILVAMYGATAGKVGRLHIEATTNQAVLSVRSKNSNVISNDYLFWLLTFASEELIKQCQGAAQPNLSKQLIDGYQILYPSITEQQKIAEILSTVDKKIDLIDQKITETEKLKTGLMQKLFSEGVGVQDENGNWQPHTEFQDSPFGKIPKCWQPEILGNILDVASSKRIKREEYVDEGVPFYRSKEIIQKSKHLSFTPEIFISRERFDKISEKFGSPQKGDILISAVGTIGAIYCVQNEEFYFKDGNLLWLRGIDKSELSSEFLECYLRSHTCQEMLANLSAGSSQSALTIVKLNKLPLIIPTEDEQKMIVSIISSVSKKINLLKAQKHENQLLKKGLMQKLLTGEWRVPVEETEAA
ncbi:restriction endonuclease subunit S [Vibrio parahaemolyticus]|nr:hypothetical protein [Vibrio parahaemolyticus]EGR3461576.1 restriction endonuclease subunit S [Vibrio parahaemolyticus]EJG0058617.1 restriction endonuclease subunit S [Vibrio parahaemolyticus]EJG0453674.1 restriction endonuclease subunit S [Vibrio parahaemolyticus]EJG0462824.1 restriction endonuclease subunit S [Vibrio parahaemolyticus]